MPKGPAVCSRREQSIGLGWLAASLQSERPAIGESLFERCDTAGVQNCVVAGLAGKPDARLGNRKTT